MHGDVVVHQRDVAFLPGDVEAEFFAQLGGGVDRVTIEGGAVAEGDEVAASGLIPDDRGTGYWLGAGGALSCRTSV